MGRFQLALALSGPPPRPRDPFLRETPPIPPTWGRFQIALGNPGFDADTSPGTDKMLQLTLRVEGLGGTPVTQAANEEAARIVSVWERANKGWHLKQASEPVFEVTEYAKTVSILLAFEPVHEYRKDPLKIDWSRGGHPPTNRMLLDAIPELRRTSMPNGRTDRRSAQQFFQDLYHV